jgi:hypothetical protein
MQRVRRQGLSLVRQWKSDPGTTRTTAAMARSASGSAPTPSGALRYSPPPAESVAASGAVPRDDPGRNPPGSSRPACAKSSACDVRATIDALVCGRWIQSGRGRRRLLAWCSVRSTNERPRTRSRGQLGQPNCHSSSRRRLCGMRASPTHRSRVVAARNCEAGTLAFVKSRCGITQAGEGVGARDP